MSQTQKRILLLVLSFLLIPIWGIGFLSAKHATFLTALLSFSFSVVYFEVIIKNWLRDKKTKIFSVFGLFAYVLLAIVVQGFFASLNLPITIAFIIIAAVVFTNNRLVLIFGLMVFLAFSILHYTPFNKKPLYDDPEKKINNEKHNLLEFMFINHKLDTILLNHIENPVLIKTWNEACGPCILSFKHLQDTWAELPNLSVFYLYQGKVQGEKEFERVFSNKDIRDCEKILIDVDNMFFKRFQIKSIPVFMLFDSEGNLCYYRFGFRLDQKNILINDLRVKVDSLMTGKHPEQGRISNSELTPVGYIEPLLYGFLPQKN
jgi:thioredoxin-related protein